MKPQCTRSDHQSPAPDAGRTGVTRDQIPVSQQSKASKHRYRDDLLIEAKQIQTQGIFRIEILSTETLHYTKLSGVVDTKEGRDAILDKLRSGPT